ncbi:acyl-CoA carboxylase subunit epsilon [Streptomyces bobili]|uniref:acyl-CoA carboxylase subunit epsilon n=1 Tax=Streptomyces bobili TaxID=67280 RepID=UPI0033AAD4C1
MLIRSLAMLRTKHADLPSRSTATPRSDTRGEPTMSAPTLRVEKGHAEPEEVAAITAVLLARAAAQPADAPTHRSLSKAVWRRLERERTFPAPHSWHY